MILVADSGSTKCDWLLDLGEGHTREFHTMGFNPLFHTSDVIAHEILKNSELMGLSHAVTDIFFYGASVSSDDRRAIVINALKSCFPKAKIHADHDLTGAARATCGHNPGIACILGTGSNSCYFDGTTISEKVPALGFILGDEAGGAWFGKEFIRHYLYHELPENIEQYLHQNGIEKEDIFTRVYKSEGTNVYLASFMKIIHQFKKENIIHGMLQRGFKEFLKIHVCKFENYKEVPVHFVGSVAINFREELTECCASMGIQMGVFTNHPVTGLLKFHQSLSRV